MTVVRNPKGKVTVAFPKGLRKSDRDGLRAAIDKMLMDLGWDPQFPEKLN